MTNIHPNSWWVVRWWDRIAYYYIGTGINPVKKLAQEMGEEGRDSPSDRAVELAREWEAEIKKGNLYPWD